MSNDSRHFDQRQRRKAEYTNPPNIVRTKVGTGGLGDAILQKAQEILESNTTDFAPIAESYLSVLTQAIENAKLLVGFKGDHEPAISAMIYPAMQLKANGGMFHFNMITLLADKKVQFLEVIDAVDQDVIDLANAFNSSGITTMNNNYAAWQVPTGIHQARLAKISANFDF